MPSNVTITQTDAARNLGVIFDSSLTVSDHISSLSKSCFLAIRDLRRIRSTLDYTTAQTIATFLIHSKVDYCNSLFLNFPHFQRIVFNSFLTPPLALFLKLLNPLIFHPFSNHYVSSKSTNAFTTKFSQLPTKPSYSTNPPIFTIFFMPNLTLLLVHQLPLLVNAPQSTLALK